MIGAIVSFLLIFRPTAISPMCIKLAVRVRRAHIAMLCQSLLPEMAAWRNVNSHGMSCKPEVLDSIDVDTFLAKT